LFIPEITMRLKILQLNILAGRFIDTVAHFLTANNYDLIHLQEVARGAWFDTHQSFDNFGYLKKKLGKGYHGELAIAAKKISDPTSYFANATFYRTKFQLLERKIIWLKKFRLLKERQERAIQDDPRNALCLKLQHNHSVLHSINTHLTWGPKPRDQEYKITQAKRLYRYLKTLTQPFILTGDFNLTPDTKIVKMFETIAVNLIKEYHVTNTLNPRVHYAQELFPKGLAIDYIFTSPTIKASSFAVVNQPNLSDHFGLQTEIEL